MSSIKSNCGSADELLDLHIEAARWQFNAECIENCAHRFRLKLPHTHDGTRPSLSRLLKMVYRQAVGWTSLAAIALILSVAISFASFLLPHGNSTALAQVQQWFTSFRTLQVEATVVEGDTVTDVLTWFDETGATRIESNGTTTIVKPEEGMIYVLRPDGQSFSQQITPDMVVVENSAAFIDLVQTFVEADRLAESRIINGASAIGYKRESDEWSIVLWVDPSDGRPLLVEQESASGVMIRSALSFNVPLPENAFDVPD